MQFLARHGLTLAILSLMPLGAAIVALVAYLQAPVGRIGHDALVAGDTGSVRVRLQVAPAEFGLNSTAILQTGQRVDDSALFGFPQEAFVAGDLGP